MKKKKKKKSQSSSFGRDIFFQVVPQSNATEQNKTKRKKTCKSQNKPPQSKIALESIVYIPRTLWGDGEWASKWTVTWNEEALFILTSK